MRDPRAIVTGVHFPKFVLAHFFEGLLICFGIILDGNLCRHASHGVNAAPMAGLNQQIHIELQEMLFHCQRGPVGQYKVRAIPKFFDEAENVVPPAAVQA